VRNVYKNDRNQQSAIGNYMIRFIYNLFWPIGVLFFLPGYITKMRRRGGYREKFGQRFGIYNHELRNRLSKRASTWLHAVSVGEVNVALKLANALHALEPDLHCVLTTTTTTGFAHANRNAPGWIEVMYTPLDYWPIMRRAFAVIRPARILLIEAEVWPNLVAFAHARRIPTALVNARLSQRSERRFRRFRFFVAPTFRLLDLVCVQEPQDVDRWTALGVLRNRICVVGSIKYDPVDARLESPLPQKILRDLKIDSTRPILFGGSTHDGEEEILSKIYLKLRAQFTNLFLIVAPRHAERAGDVRSALEQLGLRVTCRTRLSDVSTELDCLLLDSTGELRYWYGVATVVFIGKSLTAYGGQNPVEPILAGKPVVFGPNMENFATLAKALVSQTAAMQARDADSLQQVIAELLRDPDTRQRLVRNARQVLSAHEGATARTAALIHELRSEQEPACPQ
jgi:3-deoxy-D-manno-octulosonic-acid transferase